MLRTLKSCKVVLAVVCLCITIYCLFVSVRTYTNDKYCANIHKNLKRTSITEDNNNKTSDVGSDVIEEKQRLGNPFSGDPGFFLLENESFCTLSPNVSTLLMILSAAEHFQHRETLRQTWTNATYYKAFGEVKTVFLLGITNDESVQKKINKEFHQYGDIVQGPFLDTYHNLSLKSLMGYKWATTRCENAKYILKSDDDIIVNMFKVLQNDPLQADENHYDVYCLRFQKAKIIRNKSNKFYVRPDLLRGQKYYPPYCNGQFVLMSNKISKNIYRSALQTPPFWISDVYFYGMVMGKIPTLKYKGITSRQYGNNYHQTVNCLKRQKKDCPHLYTVTTQSDQIVKLWTYIEKINRK